MNSCEILSNEEFEKKLRERLVELTRITSNQWLLLVGLSVSINLSVCFSSTICCAVCVRRHEAVHPPFTNGGSLTRHLDRQSLSVSHTCTCRTNTIRRGLTSPRCEGADRSEICQRRWSDRWGIRHHRRHLGSALASSRTQLGRLLSDVDLAYGWSSKDERWSGRVDGWFRNRFCEVVWAAGLESEATQWNRERNKPEWKKRDRKSTKKGGCIWDIL